MSAAPDPAVRLSVLDRLLDESPRQAAGPSATVGASPAAFKAAFLRDLEWLLNTRRVPEPAPDRFPELERSLYHFGLPDVTSLSADSPDAHERLAHDIETCVRVFEPRLLSPRVTVIPADGSGERRVRFVIEGVLHMDPVTERVVLDTILDTPTGRFTVGA